MKEKEEKINQIVLGIVFFGLAILIDKFSGLGIIYRFATYLIPYFVLSVDTIKEAIEGIKEKHFFNENLLMLVASFGAMIIGFLPGATPEFIEGIMVMLLFQVGELFEIIAEGKSEKSITNLMNIRAEYANLEKDAKIIKINPKKLQIGDIIVINPSEKVPADGIIIEGETSFNTSVVTGEAMPREGKVNDIIYSGFINQSGVIRVKVTKTFDESTASVIIKLVKKALDKKSSQEKFITKFAKIYTPTVLTIALLMALVPSILFGNYYVWIKRALTFLVISCPCALVVSVPLAYFGGIGGASKKGILFKGANYLEKIKDIKTIVFDKTGTLTEGLFEVNAIHEEEINKDELVHIAYHVEEHSNHPIAISLKKYYEEQKNKKCHCKITNIKEIAGFGMQAKVNGEEIFVGNDKLMKKIKIKYKKCELSGTTIHIASKEKYYGHIVISDKVKTDASLSINYFKKNHIKTIMLTGDLEEEAKNVANKLGIDEYYASLLPEDKVKKIESLCDGSLAYVGDGINDAPSIARSDIGISFGGIGTDAAISVSDVILMQDKLSSLIDGIKISKKTNGIAKENILFAIGIKVIVLILSGLGITNMAMAIFADVGVTILAILNSFRTLK